MVRTRSGVQIPSGASDSCSSELSVIAIQEWKEALLKANYSKGYLKKILAKIPVYFDKSVYNYQELYNVVSVNYEVINKDDTAVKMVRLILNYCEKEEIFTDQQLIACRKKIKTHKSGVDNHVPTVQEILHTLSRLSQNSKLMYLVYVVSGIRKAEGEYLLDNLDSLKCQQLEGFTKITMNYLRHNKNSYFCYLPLSVYSKLIINHKQLSLSSLEQEIKRKKLISIKYCRKFFYTLCIQEGVPESIADYYQGRSANSVGSNHYLSRQLLADQNYKRIVSNLNSFNL